MPPASACPDIEKLRQVVSGSLPPAEEEALERHLLECLSCIATARSLEKRDTVSECLGDTGSFAPKDPASPAEVNALISRFKSLRPTTSNENTIDAIQTDPPDNAHQSGSSYSFLTPPQQADELGRLGNYRVLKLLSTGGMGMVFVAEDIQLQRQVALKVIKPELAAQSSAGKRFLREAQAAAKLKHDHVVTIYQVGEDHGVLFLAMELLEGESLEDRIKKAGKLSPAETVRIGRETAEGLAAAHERGLIHRDIKPANLWLEGRKARVKILDFGLARPGGEDAQITQEGAIVGTPAYMAPEQATAVPLDQRCDLFSLGCVLYRCCTGSAPFRGKDTISTLMSVANDHPAPPREVDPAIPRPLSDLIMSLLAKKREDRPGAASEAVDTLVTIERQVQADQGAKTLTQPTTALRRRSGIEHSVPRPPEPPAGKLPRWLIAAAVLGVLAIGGWYVAQIIIRVPTEHGELVVQVMDEKLEAIVGGKVLRFRDAKTMKEQFKLGAGQGVVIYTDTNGNEVVADEITVRSGKETRLRAALKPKVVQQDVKRDSVPLKTADSTERSPLDALDPAAIHSAERFPWQPKELVAVIGEHRQRHWNLVNCMAVSPDGKTLATGGQSDQQIRFWDIATQRELPELPMPRLFNAITYTPDGKSIVVGGAGWEAELWDLGSGATPAKLRAKFPGAISASYLAFSDDGGTLAMVGGEFRGEAVYLWDMKDKQPSLRIKYDDGVAVALAPNGKTLAVAHKGEDSVRLYDLAEPKPKQRVVLPGKHSRPIFSPDGRLVTQDPANNLHFWNLSGTKPASEIACKLQGPSLLAFSAKGERMASCVKNVPNPIVWKVQGTKATEVGSFSWTTWVNGVGCVALSADGQHLYTGHQNGAVRFWEVAIGVLIERNPVRPQPYLNPYEYGPSIAFLPAGPDLVSVVEDRSVRFWRFGGASPAEVTRAGATPLFGSLLAASADGKRFVIASDGFARLWQSDGGSAYREKGGFPFTGSMARGKRAAFSPDGDLLAVAYGNRTAVMKVSDNFEKKLFCEFPAYIPTFSPDGKKLFACDDEKVRIWNVESDKLTEEARIPYNTAGNRGKRSLAVTPDGKTLAVSGEGIRLELWDVSSPKPRKLHRLGGHTYWSISFSPDGRTLASAGSSMALWDAASGKKLRDWKLPGPVDWVQFAPDGRHLFTANSNGTIYVLRLAAAPKVENVASKPSTPLVIHPSLRPPEVKPGSPISPRALVPKPTPIKGLRSWSIELAGGSGTPVGIAWSPDGRYIATGTNLSFGIHLWDRHAGIQKILQGHEHGNNTALAFSPDSRRLASGGHDATVRVWDLQTGKCEALDRFRAWVWGIQFSADGKRLAVAARDNVSVVNLETGTRRSSPAFVRPCNHIAWSPDGKTLAVTDEGDVLSFLDAESLAVVNRIPEVDFKARISWSPGGQWFVYASKDIVKICDGKTYEPIESLDGGQKTIFALRWSSDGKRLASISYLGNNVVVWDVANRRALHKTAAGGTVDGVWSADDTELAIVGHSGLRVLDSATGKVKHTSSGRGNYMAILSPDGRRVYHQRTANESYIWDAESGSLLNRWTDPVPRTSEIWLWSPRGDLLAALHGLAVRDANTGKLRFQLAGDPADFSPDGKYLASAVRKTAINIWNMADGKLIKEWAAHDQQIGHLAWSPDGTRLASIGLDSVLSIWDWPRGNLLSTHKQLPMPLWPQLLQLAWEKDGKSIWVALNTYAARLDLETGKFSKPEHFSIGNSITKMTTAPDSKHLLLHNGDGAVFLRDQKGQKTLADIVSMQRTQSPWHPDSRRLLLNGFTYDVHAKRRLGHLIPDIDGKHWACIGPTGHYKGSEGVEKHLRYVALTEDGHQLTLTAAEFAQRYGWKNDSGKATLLKLEQ